MKGTKSFDSYVRDKSDWREELLKLRQIMCACGLQEEIKWGAPCYTHKGKNVVGVVAFKPYVGLWFHQGALLKDERDVLINAQRGKTRGLRQWRMHSTRDIKPRIISSYVKEAIALVDAGKRVAPVKKSGVKIHALLDAALQKDKSAASKFAALTPGRRREYSEHIAAAKREETQHARLQKIIPMIKSGKGLNDKYRR